MRLDDAPSHEHNSSPPPASFDDVNKDWEPPVQDLPPVPEFIHDVITSMLRDVWGVHCPRDYQIRMIFHLVYRQVPLTYLI